jgi:hypothetical protein
MASRLDAFSVYPKEAWLLGYASGKTTHKPLASLVRSSRTRTNLPQSSTVTADMDRPVSRRSEPSSRTLLMGEQPNAWDLLQPRARVSRHRGAERGRRYELSGHTSLLSPG